MTEVVITERCRDEIVKWSNDQGSGNIAFLLGFESAKVLYIGYPARFPPGVLFTSNVNQLVNRQGVENASAPESTAPAGQESGDFGDFNVELLYSQARQLLRMLPGGVDIVGLLTTSPSEKYSKVALRFLKRLRKLRDRHVHLIDDSNLMTKKLFYAVMRGGSIKDLQFQMLDFDYSSGRLERVANFKFEKVLWCRLDAIVSIDEAQPCYETNFNADFFQHFLDVVMPFCLDVVDSSVLFNGASGDEEQLLCNLQFAQPLADPCAPEIAVKLLLNKFYKQFYVGDLQSVVDASAEIEVDGVLRIRAFVPFNCTVRRACLAIFQDVARTLYIRGELHHEERMLVGIESTLMPCHNLPRRIFADLHFKGQCFDVGEYMLQETDVSFFQSQIRDFIGLRVEESSVEIDAEPYWSTVRKFTLNVSESSGELADTACAQRATIFTVSKMHLVSFAILIMALLLFWLGKAFGLL